MITQREHVILLLMLIATLLCFLLGQQTPLPWRLIGLVLAATTSWEWRRSLKIKNRG